MSEIRDKVKKQLSWVHTEIGTPSGNQKTYLSPDQIDQILLIPELAIVDTKADLVSAISFNLGLFQGEIGDLFGNYPTNFNLIMERLRKVLDEAGWVKEVKD